VGVGLGYKSVGGKETTRKSIVVLVDKKKSLKELRRGQVVPEKIEEAETDVIETGKFKLLGRTDKVRPALPGVSIGHYKVSAGTFGALVREKETGKVLILSNNHVLANATNGSDGRAVEGDSILQPGVYDGGLVEEDTIARLYRFVPLYSLVEDSQCPVAAAVARGANSLLKIIARNYRLRFEKEVARENIVDAALAEPIKRELVSSTILEIGRVEGLGEAGIGDKVRKSGRTSGVTEGHVKLVEVTVRVSLEPYKEAVFSDQVMTDMLSRPGDSGSLVLDVQNRAVGLLFAGSGTMTIFNKISNVMELLNVELL